MAVIYTLSVVIAGYALVACIAYPQHVRALAGRIVPALRRPAGEYTSDDRCAVCGEHIADPHAPGCDLIDWLDALAAAPAGDQAV